jgi:hypothetical protein
MPKKQASTKRNRVKVGKLSQPSGELSKAKQKRIKGGLGDGSVHIVDGTSNTVVEGPTALQAKNVVKIS